MTPSHPEYPAPPEGELAYGKAYWRSIEEKLGDPSFRAELEREFPPGATEPPQGVGRRELLQLLGASLALAGAAGCSPQNATKILPYTNPPNGLSPGNPLHYASVHALGGIATGILVTSWEGRPTKVEGNPDHPASLGATGVFEQAMLLGLYDPNRARLFKRRGAPEAWRTFLADLERGLSSHAAQQGSRLRFLVEPTGSPLLSDLRGRILQRFPKARFYAYDGASRENGYAGARLAFGRPLEVQRHFSKADVVVSLDDDFLQPLPANIRGSLDFAQRRDPEAGPLNRLYAVESAYSITGAAADHRLRVRPSEVLPVALALLSRISASPASAAARSASAAAPGQKFADAAARDLLAHPRRSLVLAGDRQPPLVHAVAHAINDALGNHGHTATFTAPVTPDVESGPASLRRLADEVRGGAVDTLVVTANNPVYAAPWDLDLGALLAKVPHSLYLSQFEDETAAQAEWFIPRAHPLEAWGDGRGPDGTVAVQQPLIQPLYGGVTEAELYSAVLGKPEAKPYELVRDFHRASAKAGRFDDQWERWLARGGVPDSAFGEEPAALAPAAIAAEIGRARPAVPSGLELSFRPDYKVHDGRFADNPWLQELPDPITKMTWDNAAHLSPQTAKRLGVATGDVVLLRYRGRQLEAPVWIQPGHADEVVTLVLGYGRSGAEKVAEGVGVNANLLRHSEAPWFDGGLEVRKTLKLHRFSVTQTHWAMEGRPLALDQDLADFQAAPEALTAALKGMPVTIHEPVLYPGYRWAMSIDLSRCTGCMACVVACQAENNIPVVGPEQVANGREMHWIRIDRYYAGDSLSEPRAVFQPMLCQHCETAPCEYVCPVNATVHSDEGLNEMVYNRCVGTRYCGNNCPYKVRRFNYFHYTAGLAPSERLAMNPDVTVRSRGVMEKCTYCVQRIERARIDTRVEGRSVRDGEIQTACQQACPARAIVFGTLSDPAAQVTERHGRKRRYDVLHDLGTRPRTAYLVRIRNPNPELA